MYRSSIPLALPGTIAIQFRLRLAITCHCGNVYESAVRHAEITKKNIFIVLPSSVPDGFLGKCHGEADFTLFRLYILDNTGNFLAGLWLFPWCDFTDMN